MRISTANAYDASIDTLMKRQRELTETQLQLTSGKRVNRASDDPAAASRAERALARSERAEASQRAVEASRTMMSLTEGTLGEAAELMQQIRETMVSAGNASYSDAERASLAQKLEGLREQLLTLANRSDGANGFVFGGQGSSHPPFVDAPGGVQYRGTTGHVQSAGEDRLPLSTDGQNAWMSGRTGNGVFETRAVTSTGTAWIDAGQVTQPTALTGSSYSVQFSVTGSVTSYSVLRDGAATALTNVTFTPGKAIEIDGLAVTIKGDPAAGDEFQMVPSTPSQSVFDVIDRSINALKTSFRSGAQIAQANAFDLRDVDSALNQLQTSRAAAGDVLNHIEGISGRLETARLLADTDRSNAQDLDMVHAISEFQNKQTGYDAALKSYSMVQRMSLLQYLNF